nr:MAG TPA: hypothetical protein [Bacteriophage sp.]
MKKTVKILGYFVRKRDRNEYVLYEEDGELFLTNGVFIWNNKIGSIEKKYLPELEEVDAIKISEINERLKHKHPHAAILTEIEKIC